MTQNQLISYIYNYVGMVGFQDKIFNFGSESLTFKNFGC